jgi:hypothetical protein
VIGSIIKRAVPENTVEQARSARRVKVGITGKGLAKRTFLNLSTFRIQEQAMRKHKMKRTKLGTK